MRIEIVPHEVHMSSLPLSYTSLLIIHAGATLLMTGVIWVIQLVHYPLFAQVGASGYQAYQAQHMKRITWLVGPLMVTEAGATLLLFKFATSPHLQSALLGLVLLGVIWLSTATLQVPAHARLTLAWDESAHQRLVWTNWIRTLAWSARALIALSLLR